MKTKIKVHLPSSAPDQSVWHLVLDRLPRLVTTTAKCPYQAREQLATGPPRLGLEPLP